MHSKHHMQKCMCVQFYYVYKCKGLCVHVCNVHAVLAFSTEPADASLGINTTASLLCRPIPSSEDHTVDGSIVAAIVASLLFVFFSGAFLVCTVFVCKKVRRKKYSLQYKQQQETNGISAHTDIRNTSVSLHTLEGQVCMHNNYT